ncbi:OmpA family protein [Paracraurococcus lichenis]|uniref:OmpA family protein n=1 Tax=Paracraurococcus lichenis TaxID=3064888 RepID=A0ABT9E5C6_9PROT|nr:OmpA family protein [Paracraurococcus sp. LOR1-02]MDO9711344.1 OmpA family protein [Paracraurococcus sp. LOR1-02]
MASIISRSTVIAGALLSPLLIAGCVSQKDYDALQAENQQLRQQVASQSAQLNASRQQVSRLQNAIEYTVNSDLLFRPGSWEMNERGKHIIADLASKLAPTQQNKVTVNGYTDNAPIGPTLRREGITSNQELSQRRADAVMKFLVSQGVRPDMISAQGHGEANPVASNDTPKGRAQNRRVVLSAANA